MLDVEKRQSFNHIPIVQTRTRQFMIANDNELVVRYGFGDRAIMEALVENMNETSDIFYLIEVTNN